jgi:hypothetical protein
LLRWSFVRQPAGGPVVDALSAAAIGDDAVTVPETNTVLDRVTQISGSFNQASATAVAHAIAP